MDGLRETIEGVALSGVLAGVLARPDAAEVPLLREALRDVATSVALLQRAFSAWEMAEHTLLGLGQVRGGLERAGSVLEGRLHQVGSLPGEVSPRLEVMEVAAAKAKSFADPLVPVMAALWRVEWNRTKRLSRWIGHLEAETIELPETVPALVILRRLKADACRHTSTLRQILLGLLEPGEERLLKGVLDALAEAAAPRTGRSLRLIWEAIVLRFSGEKLPAPAPAAR